MSDQDADLILIRDACDAYRNDGTSPPNAFYDAVHRHSELLRRTARRFAIDGHEDDLMPPAALRFAASYLLSN